ncbi:MAG: hypothetical protein OJF49_000329 [Ktedonobacterales bacterium]|nr:MAG: hypothetical protein OJF49_000329 [Ktedonobacterales bacterium]
MIYRGSQQCRIAIADLDRKQLIIIARDGAALVALLLGSKTQQMTSHPMLGIAKRTQFGIHARLRVETQPRDTRHTTTASPFADVTTKLTT